MISIFMVAFLLKLLEDIVGPVTDFESIRFLINKNRVRKLRFKNSVNARFF